MKNIKILKTGIDTSKILSQLKKHDQDWGNQRSVKNAESLIDRGYDDIPVGNLQLIMGGVKSKDDFVGDSEINVKTPAYQRHTEIRKLVKKLVGNKELQRCGFLSLPIDGIVGAHIDEGTYYLTRDRYHISVQGTYQYFCGGESVVVEPGTFLWFNNKLPHGTVNLGDIERITFVFDISHSPDNPQHKLNDGEN